VPLSLYVERPVLRSSGTNSHQIERSSTADDETGKSSAKADAARIVLENAFVTGQLPFSICIHQNDVLDVL